MNRADYEVGTLESEIKVQFEQAVSALNQTTTALDGVVSLLKDTNSQLNNLKNNTGLKDLQKQSMNFKDVFKSTAKVGIIAGSFKKGFNTIKNITSASIDMIETTNLFEVQMGKVVNEYGKLDEAQSEYYTRAMAFQDKMNEKLGTNKSEMQKYQAMYYGMLNSQLGSNNKNASYLISESLTKAGYDIASLYNLDVETAMNKLKSGLAGQIESLRQIGIDVSEASLAKVLDQVGIERSVQQLSYAEKEVARYIAICQQAGQAQGDFARTFEQPANQIRVFKNQMIELKQVAGSFFVGLFGQIMPVINGIIMAIKEVLKALGSVFGFEVDVGNSSLGTVEDTVGDIGSGLGSATKKAKEFKKQLMGFDEINNITPPSDSSGGSGGGSVNGVDSALLNALKEWDNKMDSISGKAQEIRDKILDWLGVTDGSYENLKRIWEIVQTIGVAFGTWKVSKSITNLLKNLGILNKTQAFQIAFGLTLTLTGIFAQYNGTKKLLNGDINLFSILETILGTASGALGIVSLLKATKFGKALSLGGKLKVGLGIMLAIQGVQVLLDGIKTGDIKKTILGALESVTSLSVTFNGLFGKSLFTSIKKATGNISAFGSLVSESFKKSRDQGLSLGKSFVNAGNDALSLIPKGIKVTAGLTGLTTSSVLTYNAMKDLGEGSIGTTEGLLKLSGGILGATASGALIGSTFGPAGTILGAFAGFVSSSVSALLGYSETTKKYKESIEETSTKVEELTEELKNNKEAYDKTIKSIQDTAESKLVDLEYSEKLTNQLEELVDENGKVKKGNEERADFILNELNSALGTEYELDGDIITQNGEIVKSYSELKDSISKIIEKRKEEAKVEATQEIYKEALKEEIKARKDLAKAQETYNETVEKSKEAMKDGAIVDSAAWGEVQENLKKAKQAVEDAQNHYDETLEDIKETDTELTNELIKQTGKISNETIEQGKVTSETLKGILKNSADEWEKSYNDLNETQRTSMLAQSTALDTWSPTIQQKWADMAHNSSEEYEKALNSLEPYTKLLVETVNGTIDTSSPDFIQKWKNMATDSHEQYEKALEKLPENTNLLIKTIVNGIDSLTPENIEKWQTMANESSAEYEKALESLPEDTKLLLNMINNKVDINSPEFTKKWQTMSEASKTKFNEALKSLPEDTQGKILASIIAVDGLNEKNAKAYRELSDNAKRAFNNAMNGIDADARNKIQSALNQIDAQQYWASQAGGTIGRNAKSSLDNNLGDTTQSANNFLQGFKNVVSQSNPLNILGSIGRLANSFVSNFNWGLGNHSPSKKTRQSAKYFMEGFSNQLSALKSSSLKQVQNLAEGLTDSFNDNLGIAEIGDGIKINTKDFKIDTNQNINYSDIKGQILAQSKVSIDDNITNRIAEAITQSMKNAEVNVNIEAKTEEGVIVKKASKGIREYVMQTGELPFPIPV